MRTHHEKLLEAHHAQDHDALVTLYARAAREASNIDAACFFLTHAYIYALEHGHPDTADLHAKLALHDRV